jgi:hypothetical protein
MPTAGNEFEGSKKVTCKKAVELFKQDKIVKAWFRPNFDNKVIGVVYTDEDDCYVWYRENEK